MACLAEATENLRVKQLVFQHARLLGGTATEVAGRSSGTVASRTI
jgi:hypothetical protein